MSTLSHVFDELESREVQQLAALDIGSNSFHLVIARSVAGSIQIVQKIKQKVRLADGLDEKNRLSEAAIERGLATLQSMAESMQGLEPQNVRVVATHTLRRAKNARAFLRRARSIFPFTIEIISGPEEARLIYNGIANTSDTEGQRLILDIGGGSTEFALGAGKNAKLCKSVQMGCVSYQQRFFKDGVINQNRFNKAVTHAQQEIELVVGNIKRHQWETTIGSSGTARAISSVLNANSGIDAELPVEYKQLKQLIKLCCEKGHADKLDFEGLSDDRRPVFAAGLSILFAIFKSLKLDNMITSAAALREGVLYEMKADQGNDNIRERTAESLATRYDVDTAYAKKVWATCIQIFEQAKAVWPIDTVDMRHLMGWAALLHEVGLQINSRGVQRHSSYIIEQTDMPGFNQEQQKLIAVLVRFHRKKIRRDELPSFANYSEQAVVRLLAIVRLGVLLNINRQESSLPAFTVFAHEAGIALKFPDDWFEMSPLLLADIEQENDYWQALDMQLSLK